MILIALMAASVVVAVVSHTRQVANQPALLDRQAKGATLQNVMVDQAVVNALLNAGAPGGWRRYLIAMREPLGLARGTLRYVEYWTQSFPLTLVIPGRLRTT